MHARARGNTPSKNRKSRTDAGGSRTLTPRVPQARPRGKSETYGRTGVRHRCPATRPDASRPATGTRPERGRPVAGTTSGRAAESEAGCGRTCGRTRGRTTPTIITFPIKIALSRMVVSMVLAVSVWTGPRTERSSPTLKENRRTHAPTKPISPRDVAWQRQPPFHRSGVSPFLRGAGIRN